MVYISKEDYEHIQHKYKPPSYNKYHNTPVKIDNVNFDSKREANRYVELRLLEQAGEIKDLLLQPKYELIPAFIKKDGRKFRGVNYFADFKYWDIKTNAWVIEDVKGIKTDVFLLKLKMFEFKYPELTIVLK